jgi:hypothetical protein
MRTCFLYTAPTQLEKLACLLKHSAIDLHFSSFGAGMHLLLIASQIVIQTVRTIFTCSRSSNLIIVKQSWCNSLETRIQRLELAMNISFTVNWVYHHLLERFFFLIIRSIRQKSETTCMTSILELANARKATFAWTDAQRPLEKTCVGRTFVQRSCVPGLSSMYRSYM